MSDGRVKFDFGLWKNEDRQKDTHPHLRASRPVEIDGSRYWAVCWVKDGKDPALAARINQMIGTLADANGNVPILSIILEPADEHQQTPRDDGVW